MNFWFFPEKSVLKILKILKRIYSNVYMYVFVSLKLFPKNYIF
jgi:hypothetical protein